LQHRFWRYHDLGRLHLFVRLRVVADVGKKDALRFFDQQKPRTPGETAKISDVRQMTDKERVEAGRSQMLAKSLLPRAEVH